MKEERKNKRTARSLKKSELPKKPCAACGRDFVWRKKWEHIWEQVIYCSDACREGKKKC